MFIQHHDQGMHNLENKDDPLTSRVACQAKNATSQVPKEKTTPSLQLHRRDSFDTSYGHVVANLRALPKEVMTMYGAPHACCAKPSQPFYVVTIRVE
jgi:hypothetical protein